MQRFLLTANHSESGNGTEHECRPEFACLDVAANIGNMGVVLLVIILVGGVFEFVTDWFVLLLCFICLDVYEHTHVLLFRAETRWNAKMFRKIFRLIYKEFATLGLISFTLFFVAYANLKLANNEIVIEVSSISISFHLLLLSSCFLFVHFSLLNLNSLYTWQYLLQCVFISCWHQ